MNKVEFIESYIKVGNDYQWSDNHGELIRCKDCKHYITRNDYPYCVIDGCYGWGKNDFCSRAERKEE